MFCQASWVVYADMVVLCVNGLLVVVLMQKAEHDKQISRVDSPAFRKTRRLSFIAVAASAIISVGTYISPVGLLLLFISTLVLLAVDIMALNHRPPQPGTRTAAAAGWRGLESLRHLLALLRSTGGHP